MVSAKSVGAPLEPQTSQRPGPGPIVDSHAHLDDPQFAADCEAVLARATAAGVRRILNIAYEPASWKRSRLLRERFEQIEIAIGLHPQVADRFDEGMARALDAAIATLQPSAIGETGLDYSRPVPSPSEQQRAFRWQLERAERANLPLVIHQRDAAKPLVDELERWPGLTKLVLHSFDGDHWLMDWARERGSFVGVGGLALKPRVGSLRDVLRQAPIDRLLLETDSPYLAPPAAPSRRNEPANLAIIAESLAPLWAIRADELCQITTKNADRLFGFEVPELVGIEKDAATG